MAALERSRYIGVMDRRPVRRNRLLIRERLRERRRRLRQVPVRTLVPNLITLLALCAGLTAIRLAIETRLELAIAAIVFAALLDGIDGRVARMLKGTSRFGAELDSLADFVNFGVAPALILYFWALHELGNAGWIAAMVFAICAGLRLARFNVMIDDPNRPAWAANFFVGMPAPGGAITVLLPIYLHFLGAPRFAVEVPLVFIYTLAIAFLMVSRLPVFSGKRVGKRVPPEWVLPVFVLVVLGFALLIAYPWALLTAVTVAYLASLPFGFIAYRNYQEAAAGAAAQPGAAPQPGQAAGGAPGQASAPPAGPAAAAAAPPRRRRSEPPGAAQLIGRRSTRKAIHVVMSGPRPLVPGIRVLFAGARQGRKGRTGEPCQPRRRTRGLGAARGLGHCSTAWPYCSPMAAGSSSPRSGSCR